MTDHPADPVLNPDDLGSWCDVCRGMSCIPERHAAHPSSRTNEVQKVAAEPRARDAVRSRLNRLWGDAMNVDQDAEIDAILAIVEQLVERVGAATQERDGLAESLEIARGDAEEWRGEARVAEARAERAEKELAEAVEFLRELEYLDETLLGEDLAITAVECFFCGSQPHEQECPLGAFLARQGGHDAT